MQAATLSPAARTRVPAASAAAEAASACTGRIVPDGRGRRDVRSILPSMSRSWYWFRTEAPQASRKTPRAVMAAPGAGDTTIWPVAAAAAAKSATGRRNRVPQARMVFMASLEGLQIVDERVDLGIGERALLGRHDGREALDDVGLRIEQRLPEVGIVGNDLALLAGGDHGQPVSEGALERGADLRRAVHGVAGEAALVLEKLRAVRACGFRSRRRRLPHTCVPS